MSVLQKNIAIANTDINITDVVLFLGKLLVDCCVRISILATIIAAAFLQINNGVEAMPPPPSRPLVSLDAIIASLLSLLTSIWEAMTMTIQQSAVREGRGGEVGGCGPSSSGVAAVWLQLTTMAVQGHNVHNKDEAPQTGKTKSADIVKPCLKRNNQPL